VLIDGRVVALAAFGRPAGHHHAAVSHLIERERDTMAAPPDAVLEPLAPHG
jgi:hypothetical protein